MLDKGNPGEKLTFKQSPEGNEGVEDVGIWKENVQRSGNGQCKGPEAGVCWRH